MAMAVWEAPTGLCRSAASHYNILQPREIIISRDYGTARIHAAQAGTDGFAVEENLPEEKNLGYPMERYPNSPIAHRRLVEDIGRWMVYH